MKTFFFGLQCRIRRNKVFVPSPPQKKLFMPPSHDTLAPGQSNVLIFFKEICGYLLLGANLMFLTKIWCELQKKDMKLNPPDNLSFGKQLWKWGDLQAKKKGLYPILNKHLREMWFCNFQKKKNGF